MSAIRIDSAGEVTSLDGRAEPDEVVTEQDAKDPAKLARMLARLLAQVAQMRRAFSPRRIDFEDIAVASSHVTISMEHGFGGRVRWWPIGWQVPEVTAAYRTSAVGGDTTGTDDRSATITGATGDLFVVFCGVAGNTNLAPTCSDDAGGTYTLITTAPWNASAETASCFVRNEFIEDAASIVVTVMTGSNTSGNVAVVAISGMAAAGLAAIRTFGVQENQAALATPAPALNQAALTENVTLGAVFNASNPATMTTPTGWTERHDVGQATPSNGLELVSRDSGFTGTTITWGSASGFVFAAIVVELSSLPAETAPALIEDEDLTTSDTLVLHSHTAGTVSIRVEEVGG